MNGVNGKTPGKPKDQATTTGGVAKRTPEAQPKATVPAAVRAAEKAKAGQASAMADPMGKNQARGLLIFSHFGLPKPVNAAKGDIHPAIARLALQFSTFKITGANARCIATLTAFKTVRYIAETVSFLLSHYLQIIQDYVTPPNHTLSRHLMTYLSPQINHLVAARPMSVTMGNAIRQLKLDISGTDFDLPEQDVSAIISDGQESTPFTPFASRPRTRSAGRSIRISTSGLLLQIRSSKRRRATRSRTET